MAREFIQQFVYLSSILTGFSFAIVVELVSRKDKSRATSLALASMISSSSLSIVSVTTASLLLVLLSSERPLPLSLWMARLVMVMLGLFFLRLLTFMLGIVYAGFAYSIAMGILAAVLMSFSFIVILILGGVMLQGFQ